MSNSSTIIKEVRKRDGRTHEFDRERIFSAICKAMAASEAGLNDDLAEELTGRSVSLCEAWCLEHETGSIAVDQIHEIVESVLMDSPRPDAAKEYIRYREKRNLARKADSLSIFDSIIMAQSNDITRENANMNADTPAGMMMKFASEATKTYVDECLLSDEVKAYVKANLLHIHDKDYYPTRSLTCIQHPTGVLLAHGFVDGHAPVRPAKRIETAAVHACITMEAVQNEMHGGQAIPAFDFYLAPYVRKSFEEEAKKLLFDVKALTGRDDLTKVVSDLMLGTDISDYIPKDMSGEELPAITAETFDDPSGWCLKASAYFRQEAINRTVKRVHQAMEGFVHNMNTIHSRGGNQVVFSSINYGTDTSPEGRCVIREILNTTYEGVGNGETAIFPIQIWKKKRGVSYLPGDPNYDLYCYACKVTARRFFPNYLNLDASYNVDPSWKADDPERFVHEVATMGCRTRVFENRFGPKTSIGRGNLSFSTLNLPGLAVETMRECGAPVGSGVVNGDGAFSEEISLFFRKLGKLLDVTALQLHQRFEFQAGAMAKQFPMLMSGMWIGSEGLRPTDYVRPVLNQGTLGIGFIGLAECLIALVGKHHAESEEAQALGLRIIEFFNDHVEQYCKKYQHNYSVLATPAEGLSGKFTKIDKKRFGIIPGVTDKEYYTNSNHVPVYYHCTPEEKARVEAPYHRMTRGGHIFYVEMDADATHNPEAVMRVVDLMDKYDMGYGSVNHNRVRCLDCGYETADRSLEQCPKCGSRRLDLLQRITGYLVGTTDRWNSGKKAELRDRVTHE